MRTEEYRFTVIWILNTCNLYEWKEENNNRIRKRSCQRQWSRNIWTGLLDNNTIGLHILVNHSLAASYFERKFTTTFA